MKLNDIIELLDRRIGTICWRNLDGEGGIFGRHHFEMPEGGFGDNLPAPEFMLRKKEDEGILKKYWHRDIECVGTDYDLIK